MITEKLLNNRFRFKENHMPYGLTRSQRQARQLFLEEIHGKRRYISLTECPYCGAKNFTKISETSKNGLPSDIVICDSCDGCFKAIILNPEGNKYLYENISYLLRGKERSDESIEKFFWQRVNTFAYGRYRFISHFINLDPHKDLVVEFGCNDGANLFPWFKEGFKVLGVELDSRMVEFGRRKGLNLVYGDLLNYEFSEEKPKLIILSHVLGHVLDVNAVLRRVREALVPTGCVFIETPGIRSHGLIDPLRYFDVEFNYCFDVKNITRLLKKHKFNIIYVDAYIRLLCALNKNKDYRPVPFSIDKLKALLFKGVIGMLGLKNIKLYDLLRQGENKNPSLRLLNKMQMLYLNSFYRAITKSVLKNHK